MRGRQRFFSARWKSLWQCRVPPLHRTQRWGTPRFGLGGKEPGAEILRWESPALPETPLPQDDHGDGIVVARLKSCPSHDHRVGGTLVRERSCGTQGPSTALPFGRDDRVCLLRPGWGILLSLIFLFWVGGRSLRLFRRGRSGLASGEGLGRGRGAGARLRGRVPIGFVCRRGRRGWRVCGRLPRTG
jgi:hypothetical protein